MNSAPSVPKCSLHAFLTPSPRPLKSKRANEDVKTVKKTKVTESFAASLLSSPAPRPVRSGQYNVGRRRPPPKVKAEKPTTAKEFAVLTAAPVHNNNSPVMPPVQTQTSTITPPLLTPRPARMRKQFVPFTAYHKNDTAMLRENGFLPNSTAKHVLPLFTPPAKLRWSCPPMQQQQQQQQLQRTPPPPLLTPRSVPSSIDLMAVADLSALTVPTPYPTHPLPPPLIQSAPSIPAIDKTNLASQRLNQKRQRKSEAQELEAAHSPIVIST
ncbi:hypothetical protein TrST_g8272 [Triparma strigata]|uniref:Uncharacterized protein n=1 Tax=Triparma strigata TaxID=1606541 RepID=A0A9W6ZMS8_9STRA|nr:hypothetical protein TrST_g8272 [Triparma strigata]